MKFACESCHAQYMISDEKVGPRGVRVRCKKCNHVNVVRRQAPATDPDLRPQAPEPRPVAGSLDDELGAAFANVVAGGAPISSETEPAGDSELRFEHDPAPERAPAPAAAPAAASVEWYLAVDDQQVGPLGFDEVRTRWDGGEIGPDTLCWRVGMADWTALSQIPELADALAPRVPAPAPASAAADKSWIQEAMTPQEPAAAPAWKPSAASALASLVEQEMEAASQPKAEGTLERDLPPGSESTGIRTLLAELPTATAPAPELSRLLPLTPSAPAAEKPAETPRTEPVAAAASSAPASAPARTTAPVVAPVEKAKKGGALKWVAAAAVLVAGGAGAAVFALGGEAEKAPAPVVAATTPTPPPAPAAPAPAPAPVPAPEPEPAAAAAGGAGGAAEEVAAAAEAGGAGGGAAVEAPAAAAVAAATPPAPEVREAAAPAKKEPAPARAPTRQAKRRELAENRTAPAPDRREAPRRSSSDDLLAAAGSSGSIDALFEREFREEPKAPSRSSGGGTYIPPAPGSGGKPHQLSQGDIAGVVVGHKSDLKGCVTNYKKKNDTSGTVVMRWTIRPNGTTTGVQPVRGTEHKELTECIGGLIRTWKFPAYSGPQMPPIDFPFQF